MVSEYLQAGIDALPDLASAATESHYRSEQSFERYGARGHARCVEDAQYHLGFLLVALEAESITQFIDYCGWAKIFPSNCRLSSRLSGLMPMQPMHTSAHFFASIATARRT